MEWKQVMIEAQKFCLQELRIKIMLIIFYIQGVTYKNSVPAARTVNSKFYTQTLKRILKVIF
jgi:hypothetical protein